MVHHFLLSEAEKAQVAKLTNYQVNADLRHLRALFNYAINELEAIEDNPTKKLQRFPIDKKMKRIPSDADIEAILKRAKPHQKKLIIFMRDTGARIGEALRAIPKDIDESRKLVTLWTRKKRYSNLTMRRIAATLDILALRASLPFPWKKQPRFLERACKSLKLPVYGWHSFRHRIASKMVDEGATILEVMNFLGHENIEVTQGYLQELTGKRF